VNATPIDPRDTEWESDYPAYRVYFWSGSRSSAWRSDEWRLTDADAPEVLSWAQEHAEGRYVTIWVEAHDAGRLGMVRLVGWEPPRSDDPRGDHIATAPFAETLTSRE